MLNSESQAWRSYDETFLTDTVSDFFYRSAYEVSQTKYREITVENSSNFNFNGDYLSFENISWLDTIKFCNAKSEKENLIPVYIIDGDNVTPDREA